MSINSLNEQFEKALTLSFKSPIKVYEIICVKGGCINDSFKIITSNGFYFIKQNFADQLIMFEAERKGLALLQSYCRLVVPEVVGVTTISGKSILILEFLEQAEAASDSNFMLASGLAELHRTTSNQFGLDHNNFIGSLPQSNDPHKSFIDFYIHQRIEPQLRLANQKLVKDDFTLFLKLFSKLEQYLPVEKPALIHGDLWSGNVMFTKEGPSIYDPAVYYGHRESDIAMAKLFGGFDKEFFEEYNRAYALEKGWEERIDLFNLYPLLVHVNLFGGGYVGQVREILKRFV